MTQIMFSSVSELLNQELNPFFNVLVRKGKYSTTNNISYYKDKLPDPDFTFDISNNKLLCNMDEFGTIRQLTSYRNCYECDDIPGVWVAKSFSKQNDFSFSITMGNQKVDLAEDKEEVSSDLLLNLIPRSKHVLNGIEATVFCLPFIDRNGQRMNTLLYGLMLENKTQDTVEGKVHLPKLFTERHYDVRYISHRLAGEATNYDASENTVSFTLAEKDKMWIPYVFYNPGFYDETVRIEQEGILNWICTTLNYYKSLQGDLTVPEHPILGYMTERCLYQSLGAIGMNEKDEIVGANWGTYPATERTWNKDMFYSVMALHHTNDPVFTKSLEWFLKYSVRKKGTKYEGGVFHSLSNSLAPIILAGMYYRSHGTLKLLLENSQYWERMKNIIDQILETEDEVSLFSSLWLSDAISLGKYHTGSNVCLWFSCKSMSEMAAGLYGDTMLAEKYAKAAERIGSAIRKHMQVEGPFGLQYTEGISGITGDKTTFDVSNYDRLFFSEGLGFLTDILQGTTANLLMHDGEESDTTLMPVYGFCQYDDTCLRNYAKFAASSYNPTYGEESRGIKWGIQSDATFPGYTSFLIRAVDKETFSGENGSLTELERLMDLDGSWWWWPYPTGAKTGEVVRMTKCGKCGWSAGVFTNLMIDQFMGIRYEACEKELLVQPLSFMPSFEWKNLSIGNAKFDVKTEYSDDMYMIEISNKNDFEVNAVVRSDADYQKPNEQPVQENEMKFLGKEVRELIYTIPAGQTRNIALKKY